LFVGIGLFLIVSIQIFSIPAEFHAVVKPELEAQAQGWEPVAAVKLYEQIFKKELDVEDI